MPGTPSTKYSLPTLAGSDALSQTNEYSVALTNAIDPLLAPSDQGLFASRPTSTGGSPGKIGRTYKSTDGFGGESFARLFRDNGTGWDEVVLVAPAAQAWQTVAAAFGATVRYYKDALGIVRFRGELLTVSVATGAGAILFNLPATYRPGVSMPFAMRIGSNFLNVTIGTGGDVTSAVSLSTGVTVSLDLVNFRAEN